MVFPAKIRQSVNSFLQQRHQFIFYKINHPWIITVFTEPAPAYAGEQALLHKYVDFQKSRPPP